MPCRRRCARWTSAPSSARRSSCSGADAKGTETDACRRPDEAVKRLREAVNYLCEYSIDRKYGYRFALEAKPNEPRGDIYMATTGNYLGFIPTLAHPEMVGVNPEVAHETMAGLNFVHAVAQAWEAGKLFHIDLNDQVIGRYDQDFRFGAANPKATFFLVKFLEDVGYDGPRHFDAHAYRTEDYEGVKDFARGCMRTYLILKERAARWNADAEIQAIVREAHDAHRPAPRVLNVFGNDAGRAARDELRQKTNDEEGASLRKARSVDDRGNSRSQIVGATGSMGTTGATGTTGPRNQLTLVIFRPAGADLKVRASTFCNALLVPLH